MGSTSQAPSPQPAPGNAQRDQAYTVRNNYNYFLDQVKSNPGAYNYNQLASYLGNNYGNYISPQEYLGAIGEIYPSNTGQASGSGAGVYSPAGTSTQQDNDYAEQLAMLNMQEGRINPQLDVARANIMDQYNSARQKLLNDKTTNERNYNTSKTQSLQDNQLAKSRIDQGVAQQNSGVQRLLGARGAGNSSAASILAPYAAGQIGNQQRGDVNRTYGRNMQALDTSLGDFTDRWNTAMGENDTNKDARDRAALSTADQKRLEVAQQRQALKPTNAAAYRANIQRLMGEIDSLGRVGTYSPAEVKYNAPSLDKYGYQQANAPTFGNQVQQQTGAYYTLLGEDEKKKDTLA